MARNGLRLNLRLGPTLGSSAALALLLVAGCAGSPPSVSPTSGGADVKPNDTPPTTASLGPPIPVLGTENFYADVLAQIGGAHLTVTSLIDDPTADPHAFEASPLAAAATADARLVVVNGLGYDAFMDKLLAAATNPDRVVIDVQRLLGLGEGVNVHIWYDPTTMPRVARAVADELARIEPTSASAFRAGEQAYLASLGRISAKVAALRATYAGTPIAFTENVAGYLTDAVGLDLKDSARVHEIDRGRDRPGPGRRRCRARSADLQSRQGPYLQQPGHLAGNASDPRPCGLGWHPDRRCRRDDAAPIPVIRGLAARAAR